MLTFLYLFLIFESAMLIAAAIYVSPVFDSTTKRPAVTVKPELPRAVAMPAAWRNSKWRNQ